MLDLDPTAAEARLEAMARRRRRRRRLLVDAALILLFVVLVAPLGAIWLVFTPSGLERLLPHLVHEENTRLHIGGVALHPGSRALEPDTWGVVIRDLRLTPTDPTRAAVHVPLATLRGPDLRRLWERRELHVARAVLVGMRVEARTQRASEPRARPPDALRLLSADEAAFWDAAYTAPADDPLPPAAFEGIYLQVTALRWDPWARSLRGEGALSARRLTTGDLAFTDIRLPAIEATGTDLLLERGDLRWEGLGARVRGRLSGIDRRATVRVAVRLTRAPIEAVIRNATGQASPVSGFADIDLDVHSGGDLPRGGGYMDAAVALDGVRIQLPPDTRAIYKDAIRLAPIARLDDEDRVVLEAMRGTMTLTRGRVTLHELTYGERLPVFVRGTVDTDALDILFRIVLVGDPATHPGVGLRLSGPHATPTARRATRDELLPDFRELRDQAREDRSASPAPRRGRRRGRGTTAEEPEE